ncbi:MAG: helix-turn-helix transcriptional regulator [Acidobacteria bacterium]|nr:helix-turn-helix transcriptional regulator [Acidobacteriota bacterium]
MVRSVQADFRPVLKLLRRHYSTRDFEAFVACALQQLPVISSRRLLSTLRNGKHVLRKNRPREPWLDKIAMLTSATRPSRGMTQREMEVLSYVADGKTNAVIGVLLGISSRTVQKHLENIFQKLGVENRTAAAGWLEQRCGSRGR